MSAVHTRSLLQFPAGDNSTDTFINGVHYNRTTLDLFSYQLYSNDTISNGSNCFLVFDIYHPSLLPNGSWINGTSCYTPYYGIRTRGSLSIAFGTAFGITLVFTLVNLRKHGRMYLREDKRFKIIGRRWQWYWMIFVAVCGLVSCFTGIDVERFYLQSLPIVLQSFFFALMLPGMLAAVWEAVRHWGSFSERRVSERDPYLLIDDDRRAKTEFYFPLVFYVFAWLSFFLVIPRSWGKLQQQRSPEQQAEIAAPNATNIRLKIGGIIAAVAWSVIVYSLFHSARHYSTRSQNRIPLKLVAALVVLAIRIAYSTASAYVWDIGISKFDGDPAWPFALGYGSSLLLLVILEIAGLRDENEDKVIIQLRREMGRAVDAELGYKAKPSWWNKAAASMHLNHDDRLKAITREAPVDRQTHSDLFEDVEMHAFDPPSENGSQSADHPDPFRDPSLTGSVTPSHEATHMMRSSSRPRGVASIETMDSASTSISETTGMTGQTLDNDAQPKREYRSMLDI
ncbi:hypothetical protein EJ05DRAFT_530605 [Pseudovirgaria hyperparasitica]|uniref:Uncharacterized protein n=1 Tax=Pseudovirgaria hyperparasitica TaxID=470096 RepID=A0A6A6WD53_9PEZI|nr:uncharacterized protein EJ05DRAFT_530605 [Pseudovirgaria hyperparasitica]KAF2760758.1 hypothetical protein EJ05DRAFT_530605 [Pseudovirgaria hyperparasitica]